jgi:uncharacterized protein (TIGR02145 family)
MMKSGVVISKQAVTDIDSIIFYRPGASSAITVTDYDGNVYPTVTIDTQTWMAKNLRTTRYNDGSGIPLVKDSAAWIILETPGYCWYNNDSMANAEPYGALYNWYAADTSKLCPAGWHVPRDDEWTALTDYLGGEDVAGGKLKEAGTTHWMVPDTGATNEYGFTALPGGFRGTFDGRFDDKGARGEWWSSTGISSTDAYVRSMSLASNKVERSNYFKKRGISVRCLKD